MKKTTIALAIAGTFAAPAMAQVAMPSGLKLYGRLNVGIDNYEAEGAAATMTLAWGDQPNIICIWKLNAQPCGSKTPKTLISGHSYLGAAFVFFPPSQKTTGFARG